MRMLLGIEMENLFRNDKFQGWSGEYARALHNKPGVRGRGNSYSTRNVPYVYCPTHAVQVIFRLLQEPQSLRLALSDHSLLDGIVQAWSIGLQKWRSPRAIGGPSFRMDTRATTLRTSLSVCQYPRNMWFVTD